jgi:hypothetical protein
LIIHLIKKIKVMKKIKYNYVPSSCGSELWQAGRSGPGSFRKWLLTHPTSSLFVKPINGRSPVQLAPAWQHDLRRLCIRKPWMGWACPFSDIAYLHRGRSISVEFLLTGLLEKRFFTFEPSKKVFKEKIFDVISGDNQ